MEKSELQQAKPLGCKKYVFYFVFLLCSVVVLLVIFALLAPSIFIVFINILWIILLGIVVMFLLLGILVILGLKKQAINMIDVMLEGSLTLLDIAEFFKQVYLLFVRYLKELILFVIPVFSFTVAFSIYILLLIFYKWFGTYYDVTFLTIGLTTGLVFVTGILNRPTKAEPKKLSWIRKAHNRFTEVFKDALEVVVFIFFITLDSTSLFFLPDSLNVPLHAEFQGYDLMERSVHVDKDLQITVTIGMLAILVEIFRYAIRIIITAVRNYNYVADLLLKRGKELRTSKILKISLRQSVRTSMDDVLKFITFTTVLIFVFAIFPRLKLLTMVVASLAALVLDLIIHSRLTVDRGNDLISRIINKIVGL